VCVEGVIMTKRLRCVLAMLACGTIIVGALTGCSQTDVGPGARSISNDDLRYYGGPKGGRWPAASTSGLTSDRSDESR
jgi:hypothetical protein